MQIVLPLRESLFLRADIKAQHFNTIQKQLGLKVLRDTGDFQRGLCGTLLLRQNSDGSVCTWPRTMTPSGSQLSLQGVVPSYRELGGRGQGS